MTFVFPALLKGRRQAADLPDIEFQAEVFSLHFGEAS
jgi:hypothetical protein